MNLIVLKDVKILIVKDVIKIIKFVKNALLAINYPLVIQHVMLKSNVQ
jgi:hypothetical protein